MNESFGLINAQDLHDFPAPIVPNNRRWWHQIESSVVLKTVHFKLRRNLTLNLGLHWEWYGAINGKQRAGSVGCRAAGKNSVRRPLWTSMRRRIDYSAICRQNSSHSQTPSNKNDWNNFAPAAGLSWSLPWWGTAETVLRMGYGISFEGAARNFIVVDSVLGTVASLSNPSPICGCGVGYTPASFTTLSTLQVDDDIPLPGAELNLPTQALQPILATGAPSQSVSAYDRVSPYTQNWSLEIQREVVKNTAVEIRYIGTKSTKLWDGIPLNSYDIFNNGLLEEIETLRGPAAILNFSIRC